MPDQEKPEDIEQEPSGQAKSGGAVGGWLFPAIILLVIGGWCFKDGFITPKATTSPLFNKVGSIVLGLGGLVLLVYELLRPRAAGPGEKM